MRVIYASLGASAAYSLQKHRGEWCVVVNSDQPADIQRRAVYAAQLQADIREERQCPYAS